MHSTQDLNSNLIKSLTSVHLPPPPSSHRPQPTTLNVHPQSSPSIERDFNPVHLQPSPYDEYPYYPDAEITADKTRNQFKSKRKSATSDELPAPLRTPPHTISRSDSRPIKKAKTQTSPTLNHVRAKKATKNPLSPQYSSPSSSNIMNETVSKPPAPSFVTSKSKSKKSQAAAKPMVPEKIPSPHKMPKVVHDSDSKPPLSYATLIGMAILRGEGRKLTLSQIYNWISSTFKYYRRNDVGWQNSIRHNLSLNKAFVKAEKSSDGKGHYWEIVPGHEMQFLRGKAGKRSFGGVQLEANTSKKPEISKDHETTQDSESDESDDELPTQASHSPKLSETTTAFSNRDDETSSSEDEDYDSDFSEDAQISSTPKAQIRSVGHDFGVKPSLKKSHTTLGLQRITLSNDDEYLDEEFKKLPTKKQQQKLASSSTNGHLKEIPSLQAPDTDWAASASGQHVIFGQLKPSITVDSPPRATRFASFPSTSSFSCNTNFELSPLKRQETGPLLEPLTPSSKTNSSTVSNEAPVVSLQPSAFLSNITKTPLRASSANNQNVNSGLISSSQINHFYSFLKTPNAKNTRTPNSNSIMKKFWNSPSLIDDFYTSPSVPRNSDDDYNYKVALFGSPDRSKSSVEEKTSIFNNTFSPTIRRKKFSSSRSHTLEHSNNYGVSDLFGVDICTVVQRAVENEKKHRSSIVEAQDSNSTDDELEGNTTV